MDYPGVEFLDTIVFNNLLPISGVAVAFEFPLVMNESQLLCSPHRTWYCISATLLGVIVVSHVVLICIFLLTNYVEHVFMCLFSICVSQGKCYSNILPCWVVWLLIIELLVLSYLGYNSFIRYTFACIISQSVACLFIFEQCWRAKLIILMKLNLDFFLYYLCFLFLSKKLCLT